MAPVRWRELVADYSQEEFALMRQLASRAVAAPAGSTERAEALNSLDVIHEMKALLDAELVIEEDSFFQSPVKPEPEPTQPAEVFPAEVFEAFELVHPEGIAGETIQQRFERFHGLNPAVYRNLRRLAFQAKARGFERIGIEILYAVMRWEYAGLRTADPSSDFKLNDHYTSRYARLLMEREPELEGLFEIRRLRAA